MPGRVVFLCMSEPPDPHNVHQRRYWYRNDKEDPDIRRAYLLTWSRLPIEHVHTEESLCHDQRIARHSATY